MDRSPGIQKGLELGIILINLDRLLKQARRKVEEKQRKGLAVRA
jgi:ABC-type proline/glycine betaine transport system permease subunit